MELGTRDAYNPLMARGFESKSVQSQWQDAEDQREQDKKKRPTKEELELRTQREGLELSRRRIVNELNATESDRRKVSLEAALTHLDSELSKLK